MREAQGGQSQGQVTTIRVVDAENRPSWTKTTMKWTLGTRFPSTTNLLRRRIHARAPTPEPHLLGTSRSQTSRNQRIHKTKTVCVTDLSAEENTGIDGMALTRRTLEEDEAKAIWTLHQRPSGMYCHPFLVASLAHHTGPGRPRSDIMTPKSRLLKRLTATTRRLHRLGGRIPSAVLRRLHRNITV